jgi:hypothetical protein
MSSAVPARARATAITVNHPVKYCLDLRRTRFYILAASVIRGSDEEEIGEDLQMNYSRVALATLGGMVAYFAVGFLLFAAMPYLRNEFAKYPAIYRSQEEIKQVMPLGMAAMLVAIAALAVLYAMSYHAMSQGGSGLVARARFGALVGVFAIGSFVVHNYVNLQIGLKLTMQQAAAYFFEWVLVGIAMGLIYRPAM